MINTESRALPWRMETTLAFGFFLIMLLGILGDFQTVRSMQQADRRSHRLETQIDTCVMAARDVILHSHDTSFYTLCYIDSGHTGDRDQKWAEQDTTRVAFASLGVQLRQLPSSTALQAQCADAERVNRELCEPQEEREIRLLDQGHGAEAKKLLQTAGTAARDALDLRPEQPCRRQSGPKS